MQNIGKKNRKMLKMVPPHQVQTNERCSGHAGTFGVKKAYHQQAMKIGKPLLFQKMADHPGSGAAADGSVAAAAGKPDYISSDCPLGGATTLPGLWVNQLGIPAAGPLILVHGLRPALKPCGTPPCKSPEKSPAKPHDAGGLQQVPQGAQGRGSPTASCAPCTLGDHHAQLRGELTMRYQIRRMPH